MTPMIENMEAAEAAIDRATDAIDGLEEQLRDALLWTTRNSYAESARILGITKQVLHDRVCAARERIAYDILGHGAHEDPEAWSLLMMYVDAAAMRRTAKRESVLKGATSWVAARIPVWLCVWRFPASPFGLGFASALGVVVLASYLTVAERQDRPASLGDGVQVADAGNAAEEGREVDRLRTDDVRTAGIGAGRRTDTSSSADATDAQTEPLESDPANPESIVEGIGKLAVLVPPELLSEHGDDWLRISDLVRAVPSQGGDPVGAVHLELLSEELLSEYGDDWLLIGDRIVAHPRELKREYGDDWLLMGYGWIEGRTRRVEGEVVDVQNEHGILQVVRQEVDSACGDSGWQLGGGAGAADNEMTRRRRKLELDRERVELEILRVRLELDRRDLELEREEIENRHRIKGLQYQREFMGLISRQGNLLDRFEQEYIAGMRENNRQTLGHYRQYDACAPYYAVPDELLAGIGVDSAPPG